MKKIMTLSQLRNMLEEKNMSFSFSSKKSNKQIFTVIDGQLKFSDDSNDSTEGLLPVTLLACHDQDNLNGSEISTSSMKKALKSFRDRPILGYLWQNDDGEWNFQGHNMTLDENGETIYQEQPVGHTVGSAKLIYDQNSQVNRVSIGGVIYQSYNEAANILRREGKCDVSVELGIRDMSYDAKSKKLCLNDFYCSGITILGYDNDGKKVNPAMVGSEISIADFSKSTDTKGEKNMNSELFNTLLTKYNKTAEDIDFDYSSLSDEDLEAKFAEVFGENTEGDAQTDDTTTAPTNDDPEPTNDEPSEPDTNFSDNNTESNNNSGNHTIAYSVNNKNFEVSLSDIQYAISELVNNQYGEADNTYYSVQVYQESKNVVMVDCWTGKAYRQSYKVRNNEYSLTGDRVEVFAQYLTQDEIAAVDDMRSKYEVASEKLAKYEAEPKKLEILNSADYSAIANSAEFEALKKDHFDMSVEDVTNKANEILLNYAKKNSAKFEKNPETKVRPFPEMPKYSKKKGRYGNLFKKD